jgi:hypothetical protein
MRKHYPGRISSTTYNQDNLYLREAQEVQLTLSEHKEYEGEQLSRVRMGNRVRHTPQWFADYISSEEIAFEALHLPLEDVPRRAIHL